MWKMPGFYIKEGKYISGKKFMWKIFNILSCYSTNIIYMIECEKDDCQKRYIGFSTQEFRLRIYKHIGYVKNKNISKAMGEHFNLPGHNLSNMKFTIIEKVKSLEPLYGREREKYHIRKFNTFYKGINITT